jgi:O-antigen/teichoic acid export membrane protein
LKLFGKGIVVTYQGDDVRQGDYCRNNFAITFANEVDEDYYSPVADQMKRKRIAKFAKLADKIFSLNPDLLYVLPAQTRFLQYSNIDLNKWAMVQERRQEERPPVVLHAPSHQGVKGTRLIRDAVERLKRKGIVFEFVLVEGMSNAEAKKQYERADLLIDQLLAGWYGGLAVELMALGKPVICYIREGDLKFVPAQMKDDLPIINATPMTIEAVLEYWITEGVGQWREKGVQSRQYVEKWHDPLRIAGQMKLEYESIRNSSEATNENAGEEPSKANVGARSFKRHVMTLVGGTVIAQGISTAVMPFLTRLYTPADFALLTAYIGIVSMLSVVIAGRYEMTIMHAENSVEADRLTMLALTCALLMSVLLGVGAAVLSQPIASLMGLPELGAWLCWLAVPVFATGVTQILSNRLNWQKSYSQIARGRVMQNGSAAITGLGLGVNKLGGGMLIGYIAGLWCAVLYFLKKTRLDLHSFDRKEISALAKQYRHYPMYSAPAAVLDIASMYACIFILGRFYSQDILGQFSLTHRLLLVPMVFVGAAVAQTFFQRAAECYREGDDLRSLLWATSKKLLLYSLPLFAMFALLAPALLGLVFGAGWHEAGEYARWVALAYWVRLGVSPISTIFMVVHRVKVGTLWQIIYFCSSFTVLGFAAWTSLPIMQFLFLYAIHEAALYGLYFWMALKVCGSSQRM